MAMKIDVLTLFPKMLEGFVSESIIGRALRERLFSLQIYNLRDWAKDERRTVDERPFGGGAGMVLQAEPLAEAVEALKGGHTHVVYLCPDGFPLTMPKVRELAEKEHLLLVSGHYESVDERFRSQCVDEEISIGDYVLTNGTLPAAVLIDAVVRTLPGTLGDEQSLQQDSFREGLLSFPQYTRPETFRGGKVPEVLLSGNHEAIARWRLEQQMKRTIRRRPDLIFN
ncbi:MAG: tRNA (guanosine(37)-N1)-methyltransferase TrmD [Opitutales bacterium]|nr:tRNA (guanosine(37)-N1)-methyltransferase TrmD [Opitutales bacterium]